MIPRHPNTPWEGILGIVWAILGVQTPSQQMFGCLGDDTYPSQNTQIRFKILPAHQPTTTDHEFPQPDRRHDLYGWMPCRWIPQRILGV